jgi:hypothetical protein
MESVTSDESSSVTSASVYTSEEEKPSKKEPIEQEEKSADAKELLGYASTRIKLQHLKEENKELKEMMARKDEHIIQLTGQLRRATASKCDLVVACTELERQKELAEEYGGTEGLHLRKEYLTMLEGRADMERQFMNEMASLTEHLCDMDRRYKNQICEKEFYIGQLEEQIRRLREAEKA